MKKPVAPPAPWGEMMSTIEPARLVRSVLTNPAVRPTVDGRYRHWTTLRHLEPPAGLSREEWWVGIKFARAQISQALPLIDTRGQPFTVATPGVLSQLLQQVDQDASGQITISEQVTNPAIRNSYLVSSLFEEAITSSQLEGASTSRRVAKEMLRTGRPPRTKSEQMILNNYGAMNFVREHRTEPLTPDLVLTLHRLVTEQTLERPEAAGRLQTPDEDRIGVYDELGELLHDPPPAGELEERLAAMCAFANADPDGDDDYLHPVARSVIVHFWLAYDHPFEDGNGRTARALFYWSMLHRGHWLTEFLTISSILKRAPAKYARSFLYSEWDDGDLTYFVLYQLAVIHRAIDGLKSYLRRKMAELRETEALLRQADLNHRQVALLGHALRTPGATYTFKSHARSHDVAYQSARNDLLDLEQRGLFHRRRAGRAHVFVPTDDLAARLGPGEVS
ncbi:MAG TPA: Fic family protein [Nitriliruptorales bacterium]